MKAAWQGGDKGDTARVSLLETRDGKSSERVARPSRPLHSSWCLAESFSTQSYSYRPAEDGHPRRPLCARPPILPSPRRPTCPLAVASYPALALPLWIRVEQVQEQARRRRRRTPSQTRPHPGQPLPPLVPVALPGDARKGRPHPHPRLLPRLARQVRREGPRPVRVPRLRLPDPRLGTTLVRGPQPRPLLAPPPRGQRGRARPPQRARTDRVQAPR